MGPAQPSVDYDVDSNPGGWTERLRVKGLGSGFWPGGFTTVSFFFILFYNEKEHGDKLVLHHQLGHLSHDCFVILPVCNVLSSKTTKLGNEA